MRKRNGEDSKRIYPQVKTGYLNGESMRIRSNQIRQTYRTSKGFKRKQSSIKDLGNASERYASSSTVYRKLSTRSASLCEKVYVL